MNITTILIIVNVFAAVAIIALVLMQQSKGDMGSAFGGGGSSSMFGSKGSANFLSRCTSTMVTLFFVSSLVLAYVYAKRNAQDEQIAPISVDQGSDVPTIESDNAEAPESEVPTIDVPEVEVPSVDTSAVEDAADSVIENAEAVIENAEALE